MGSEEPAGMGSGVSGMGGGKSKRQGMVKVLVDQVRDGIGEVARMVGWGRDDRRF